MPLKLKVCGMKYLDNIQEVLHARPDYMGFIFYEPSQRYVGTAFTPLSLAGFPPETRKVGVFVNANSDYIIQQANIHGLHLIQLHGDESPDLCAELYDEDLRVMKAFPVDERFDFSVTTSYTPYCNYFLFDTKTPQYGGSGQQFDWTLLRKYNNALPFFLSGGIDETNIESIRELAGMNIHAIDINSRFETEPGRKDADRIKKFKEQLNLLSDEVFGR